MLNCSAPSHLLILILRMWLGAEQLSIYCVHSQVCLAVCVGCDVMQQLESVWQVAGVRQNMSIGAVRSWLGFWLRLRSYAHSRLCMLRVQSSAACSHVLILILIYMYYCVLCMNFYVLYSWQTMMMMMTMITCRNEWFYTRHVSRIISLTWQWFLNLHCHIATADMK